MMVEPVKLFAGIIFRHDAPIDRVKGMLAEKFSDIDYESQVIDFVFTDYYHKEMGKPLKRMFVSFKELIMPEELSQIKKLTIEIEKEFSENGNRTVNIDPGYLECAKVILASTKNFYHRIYLSDGIYAEVTLHWQDDDYRTFNWTFPDYKTEAYYNILKEIRGIYIIQRKNAK
ncbi:DUF4416 family protein [Elusimicrobiota bacterium]